MDTITDVKHSRLQKDGGSDVTSYDAPVNLSDTGWGCSMRLSLCCYESDDNVHGVLDGKEHFIRSKGGSKGC
jgi:hypothetical protein